MQLLARERLTCQISVDVSAIRKARFDRVAEISVIRQNILSCESLVAVLSQVSSFPERNENLPHI